MGGGNLDSQSHPKDLWGGKESAQNMDSGETRPQSARKAEHDTGQPIRVVTTLDRVLKLRLSRASALLVVRLQ